MSRQSMCLNQAYDFVKKCKPNISPNFTFMGQLLDFEKALHHQTNCQCSAHLQQQQPSVHPLEEEEEDDGVVNPSASDTDSDKASPPFEVSPV